MDWRYLLGSFDGRIGRQTFWIAMCAVTIVNILACKVADLVQGDRLSAIVDLAFTYPEFAIAAKRGNDRNLPIWLLVAFFVANGILDWLWVVGWAGSNDSPSPLWIIISVPSLILLLALIVELGFRRGTPGPNPYGADPLAKH